MIVSTNFESDERVKKTEVLRQFMRECGYEMTYSVGQFEVFVAE